MNHRIYYSILVLAAAAQAAVAITASAAGPNLLSNSTFDSNVNGWEVKAGWPEASLAWDAGRMKVTNLSNLDTSTFGAGVQCVPGVQAGQAYTLQADAYDPSGQAREGNAVLRIFWLASNDCSNHISPISAPIGPNSTVKDAWQQISQQSTAPQGANSAMVMLIARKNQGQPADAPRFVLFDNASFTQDTPAPPQPPIEPGNEEQPDAFDDCLPNTPPVPEGPFDIPIPGPLGNPPSPQEPQAPTPSPTPAPQQPQTPPSPSPSPQPEQPAPPAAQETPEAAPSDPGAPLPPSTGTGLASESSDRTNVVTGTLLFLAGLAAVGGSVVWRRQAIQDR